MRSTITRYCLNHCSNGGSVLITVWTKNTYRVRIWEKIDRVLKAPHCFHVNKKHIWNYDACYFCHSYIKYFMAGTFHACAFPYLNDACVEFRSVERWERMGQNYVCGLQKFRIYLLRLETIETFQNATLTVTATAKGPRRLWRHRIVCIWNASNRRPNHKGKHMTVTAADNRTPFTVNGCATFHQTFREYGIDLLYFNKQLWKNTTHL